MSLLNINTGEELANITFEEVGEEIEFFEQFNEKILIKFKQKPLVIFNTLTKEKIKIPEFEAPEAFIFLYDKDKFLTLKDGKIEIREADGEKKTSFEN